MHALARWLAIAAIALQAAWPLIAAAKPAAVVLVPLCTVDGETHYLEQPTGKTPLEECYGHGSHCPFCFFGERTGLASHKAFTPRADSRSPALPATSAAAAPNLVLHLHGARAPPFSRVMTSNDNNGRHHATASSFRRAAAGAGDGRRLVRGGILLG